MASRLSSFTVIQLDIELMDAGKRLLLLPSSGSEILHVLAKLERILYEVRQLPSESMKYAMHPIIETLIAKELVRHPDMNVNISVTCCICEILRIMAPNAPYNDDEMKDFFELATMTFEKLSASGGCYTKMTTVLKTFSSLRLPLLMLDLKLDKLVVRLFKQFLTVADFNSSADVLEMEKIMTMIVEESQQPMLELVGLLVKSVRNDNKIASPVCWQLGEKVLKNCAGQLKTHLPDIVCNMGISLQDYSKTIAHICNWSSDHEAKVPLKKRSLEMVQSVEHGKSLLGSRIKIWKAKDGTYYEGVVESYDSRQAKHKVSYNNGKEETLNLKEEWWELVESGQASLSDDASKLRKDTINKRKLECIENDRVNVSSALNQGSKPEPSKSRSIRANPLSHKSEGYDHTELKGKRKTKCTPLKKKLAPEMAKSVEFGENLVGSKIKVWWPMDKTYYEGVVASFDHLTSKHKVCYIDGDEEILNLEEERWVLVENARTSPVPVISEVETANVDVSWLRAHLETFHRRKEVRENSSLLMEMKAKTHLVKRAAEMDLKERCADLVAAQKRVDMAERCVKVLDLVEKKLNNDILKSNNEQDSWVKPRLF